ncbi:MAG TPA: hypothetical protein VGS57_05420 [Thermoanaerobaculia bacterium]|jgi:hypothetical protein|nr:hypothetical protein [Thermoanaerobaculia bacterium]
MLRRPSTVWLLAAPAVALAAYAALLGRGFTSEDFLLIRFLGEHPPWHDLGAQFTAPWLGIAGIRFLRPLSTTLYAAEIALFGTHATGYDCVHVIVHAANALLVAGVLRELVGRERDGTRAAVAGGVLFALHPLHPNAVVFSASFATLFGAAFVFAALLAYLRYRESGCRRWWFLAFAAFLCALLSYEAAAVLPLWLAAADHLARPGPPRSQLRRAGGWLPFVALLAVYLGWRRWVFGVVLGGYDATSQRLLGSRALDLAVAIARAVRRLLLPYYGATLGTPALATATVVLVVGPALWLLRRRDRRAMGRWLVGWVWLVSGLAPFGFEAMVPGNGRYAYLAAAGVALVAAALLAPAATTVAVTDGRPPAPRLLPWIAVAAVAALWSFLLAGNLRACARAAQTAQRVQRALLTSCDQAPAAPRFVTGYPYFLYASNGDPAAQVFHYGLRDAVNPPFARPGADALPLPPLAGDELVPVVLGAGASRVWEWNAGGELRRVPVAGSGSLLELAAEAVPTNGAAPVFLVRLPTGPFRRFRLLVSAPINGAVFDVPAPAAGSDALRVEMPRDFLRTNAALYGPSTVYWWLEARDETGALRGYTRLRPLTPAASAAGAGASTR